jgi:DNA-binding Lrp family transcriptional regulator
LEKVSGIFGKSLVRHDFFIMLDGYQLPYKEVLDAPKESYPTQTRIGRISDTVLKDQDRAILSVLAEDARIPKKALADRTGLTLETVRHSMTKLEKSGIIQAYKPLIDVSKLGYCWHMMLVQFASSSEKEKEDLVSFLKNLPEVFYINRGVGNWSLSVEFHHKELEDFNATHDMIMEKFEDLISEHSVMQVLEEHKCVFVPGKELLE